MRTSSNLLLLLSVWVLHVVMSSCGSKIPEPIADEIAQLPDKIDFNFHVRPILSDRCFSCHGPDENSREASLRLDLEEHAFEALASGNGYAIVGGNPGKSLSVDRILSEDPEYLMPPPESKLMLTDEEKAILIKWIDQGAEWKEHWAFIPPQKTELPDLDQTPWEGGNVIDAFVYEKLTENKLEVSQAADKERLLRRLSLDLTGLPPTIEEMQSFLEDADDHAYEKQVDRLLNTDANAERLTMEWMDLARYADSHGMHADGWRMMWPWRDWVIASFRKNMAYDKFVTWQLAGDLLPNANHEQKLATAFNRNHPMTAEGGVIDEEFRLGYVFDRTETVSTAFMGLTLGCARCHDHKFDPVSQKEYYQVTAFFNNVKELGMTGDDGNYGPMLQVADETTEKKLGEVSKLILEKEKKLQALEEKLLAQKRYLKALPKNYQPTGLLGRYPFDKIRSRRKNEPRKTWSNGQKDGGSRFVLDDNTASVTNGERSLEEGKFGNAIRFTGNYDEVYLQNIDNFEWTDPFSVSLWFNTSKRKKGETQVLMGTAGDKNNFWRGWDFYLDTLNRLNARIIHSLPHNYLHVRSLDSIKVGQWYQAGLSYAGTGDAEDLQLFINGKAVKTEIGYNRLYKSSKTVTSGAHIVRTRSVRVGQSYRAFTGESGHFKGLMDEIQVYNRELQDIEMALLAKETYGDDQKNEAMLQQFQIQKNREVVARKKELRSLRKKWLEISNPIPEVMIMEEMPSPRATFAYSRGEYDAPMYEVNTATPTVLHEFSDNYPKNRLGFSQWLFDRNNPLTARVTVNRYWQMIFGKGLVKTPQDFGVQGALPSHPELLDWLAVDFMENGWDLKRLLKQMVMSRTYRQSSDIDPESLEADPENVYLARGASYRLPAEMIRDNALAASGLLIQKMGGESVRPYQPDGLWIEKGNFSTKLLRYKITKGDSLYRRSLYTFVKRTSPHPAMTAFDAPNRDVCTVKRENTNTPLQALVLLNDPQFVEAARVLAERIQMQIKGDLAGQIDYAFRLATGRKTKPREQELLTELYKKQLIRFREHSEEAEELLSFGESPRNKSLDASETAALTIVASTILNHDEAYMKR